MALVSAAAVTVSASAAGIVIATRPSAPLRGPLPHQLLGSRYALKVTPDLRAGHAGWCVALLDIQTATSVLPNPATCVTPRGGPLIARGAIATISPTTAKVDGWLLYAIVSRAVAALKEPDGSRLLPISSRSLPPDLRAAVTIATNPTTDHSTVAALTPLAADGRRLPSAAGTPIALRVRKVDPGRPPATGCRIAARTERDIRLKAAYTISGPLPRSLPVASGLLSCYSLLVDYRGEAATAALLVNAQKPRRRPAALPGARPLPGHEGILIEAASQGALPNGEKERLLARRVGAGWLVVQTPGSVASALDLLEGFVART